MRNTKRALALNFGKGFDSITVSEMTGEIIKELQKAGQKPSEAQVAGIVKGIVDTQLSDKDRQLCEKLYDMIEEVPKFGNDLEEVDLFAREVAYTYTRPLQNYRNPRGGTFQAGLYPVSANVPLGAQTGATPDGRLAHTPVADGVSPTAGKDVNGRRLRPIPFPSWITALPPTERSLTRNSTPPPSAAMKD